MLADVLGDFPVDVDDFVLELEMVAARGGELGKVAQQVPGLLELEDAERSLVVGLHDDLGGVLDRIDGERLSIRAWNDLRHLDETVENLRGWNVRARARQRNRLHRVEEHDDVIVELRGDGRLALTIDDAPLGATVVRRDVRVHHVPVLIELNPTRVIPANDHELNRPFAVNLAGEGVEHLSELETVDVLRFVPEHLRRESLRDSETRHLDVVAADVLGAVRLCVGCEPVGNLDAFRQLRFLLHHFGH